jgi:hypothetical protein
LAAAGRTINHIKRVARGRGQDRKRYDQDNVVQETRKGRTFGETHWKGQQCNNGIRGQGLKEQLQGNKRIKNPGRRRQLRLEIERMSKEFDRKALGLKFVE